MKVTWGKRPESAMSLPDLHETYMSDSSRIHRGFMSFSFKPTRSNSCQIHGTFMVVSWQFHGTFTSKPDLGTVCQSPLKKRFLKIGFPCRFGFFCDFSIIIVFFAICQIHVGFMALSWHFHGTFYILIFEFFHEKIIQINNWIHLKNDDLA